nr:hypothetical protein [Tanacetum cinerariifolium]
MEVPTAMISDAIKKKAGYKYYMAKKVESKKAKSVDKPEEQHVSPIKSGRGKGFMCYGDQVAKVPNKLKKDVVPRKTRSLTIPKEAIEGSKASRLESLRQKKQPVTGEGSSAAKNKYNSSTDIDSDATLYSSSSDESANETGDVDESDMDLSHIIHIEIMMMQLYTDIQTTSVVHNPEGNPKLTSYTSVASKVPLGNRIPYPTTYPKPSSLQAKAKKLLQKAKKNMKKFNFKKAVT